MADRLQVITPDETRAIHWLGSRGRYFATAATTGGAFSAWVDEPVVGGGAAPHVHMRDEEFFYVLEGHITYTCAGQSFAATAGAFVGLPKGLGHKFHVDGPAPTRMLIVTVPAGGEGFFLELSNPYAEPDDATLPPDPQRFTAVGEKYGQILLPPTLLGGEAKVEAGDHPLGLGRSPALREPGEGEAFTIGGVLFTLKAVAAQTLGSYSAVEVEIAPHATFPAHRHARYTEGLYVIEGELTVSVTEPPLVARAGSFVVVPPGAVHTLTNPTDQPVRLLAVTAPGGAEDFYRSAGRAVYDRPARPTANPGDADRLAELAPEFGIQLI